MGGDTLTAEVATTDCPDHERRRFKRFDGHYYPVRIDGRFARLRDWSAGGIGVVLREGSMPFQIGDPVAIGINSEQTHDVVVFHGHVLRMNEDDRTAGIMFDDEQAVILFIDLIGCILADEDRIQA